MPPPCWAASSPRGPGAGADSPRPPARPGGQAPTQQGGHVGVGTLRCDVAAGTGFIFGSTRQVKCDFSPARGGQAERYTGEIRRYGVDIGFTGAAVMLWGVLAPYGRYAPGALAGTYRRRLGRRHGRRRRRARTCWWAAATAAIQLQPLSVEGNTGLNIALGVAE